jgi:hypothetical protein
MPKNAENMPKMQKKFHLGGFHGFGENMNVHATRLISLVVHDWFLLHAVFSLIVLYLFI